MISQGYEDACDFDPGKADLGSFKYQESPQNAGTNEKYEKAPEIDVLHHGPQGFGS